MFPGHVDKVVKTRAGKYETPITKIAVIYPSEGDGDRVQSQKGDEDFALIGTESISVW